MKKVLIGLLTIVMVIVMVGCGTSSQKKDPSDVCTSCNGTGICEHCSGSGECGVCDGIGKITNYYNSLGQVTKDCSLCHGSGHCLLCKGSGECKFCDGTGYKD